MCSPCNKLDWSENRPTRLAESDPRTAVDLSKTQLITGGLAVTSETFKALKFSPSQTVANFFLGNPVLTCDFASSKCRHRESELIQDVRAPQSLVSVNSGDQDQLGLVFRWAAIGAERSTIAARARNEVFKAVSLTSTWIAMTTRNNRYRCQTSSMALLRRVLSSHQPSQSRKPSPRLRFTAASASCRHTGLKSS